jgi:Fur family zinc uptake transcriptional regulator
MRRMNRPLDLLSDRELALLDALRSAGRPLSAYDLLERRRTTECGLAPNAVYRALARLDRAGLVQRVASLNAWIARLSGPAQATGALAICDACGTVALIPESGVVESVMSSAARSGFTPVRPVVEVHGLCAACDHSGEHGTQDPCPPHADGDPGGRRPPRSAPAP